MRLQLPGKRLLVILVLALNSCRNDPPPVLSTICILDGTGGGDCVMADGSKKFMLPSEMLNFWATTQADEQNFSSWCYQTTPQMVKPQMDKIFQEAKAPYSSLDQEN